MSSSGFSNVDTITSKIKGIYAANNSDEYHYLILDEHNCSVDEGSKSAHSDYQTSNSHYLKFSKNDSFLQSVLLTACEFRLGAGKYGYTSILYIITPHDAK